jgi:hypothetical protein
MIGLRHPNPGRVRQVRDGVAVGPTSGQGGPTLRPQLGRKGKTEGEADWADCGRKGKTARLVLGFRKYIGIYKYVCKLQSNMNSIQI